MPTEERYITFDLEEVYKALMVVCERDNMIKPPAGELLSIEIDGPDKEVNKDLIFLNIKRAADGREERLKFVKKFFALALVFYCQGCGVPLPRRGQKVLAISDNKIVMKVTVN